MVYDGTSARHGHYSHGTKRCFGSTRVHRVDNRERASQPSQMSHLLPWERYTMTPLMPLHRLKRLRRRIHKFISMKSFLNTDNLLCLQGNWYIMLPSSAEPPADPRVLLDLQTARMAHPILGSYSGSKYLVYLDPSLKFAIITQQDTIVAL